MEKSKESPSQTPPLDDFLLFSKKFKSEIPQETSDEVEGVIFTLANEQFCQTYIRSPNELKPPILRFPRLEKDEKVFAVVKSLSTNETISVECQIFDNIVLSGSTTWEAKIQLFRNRNHETLSNNKLEKVKLKDKPMYLVINLGRFSFVSNGFLLYSNQKQARNQKNLNKNTNELQQIQHSSKSKSTNISQKTFATMLSKIENIESSMKLSIGNSHTVNVFFSEDSRHQLTELSLVLLESLGIKIVKEEEEKDFIITKDLETLEGSNQYIDAKCITLGNFMNFIKFRRL